MLPFNKRPARDARDGDSSDADSSQQRRSVPPPARSQPRVEEKPAPARAFQPSMSDEEVTTFMPSPAKKSTKSLLAESGETRTSAKKHIRPPAPSIVDEDEDEGRTQIRPMPKRGKLSLPTSSVSVAKVREPESEPAPARKDVRVPEISLPKSAAVADMSLSMSDFESAADAPDYTMQLGPSMSSPMSAPAPMKSSPPPAMPQMSTHQFAPVTSAPLRSQPPPPMASTAMLGHGPGPMPMGQQPMPMGMSPAMMSGQVQAMSPAMMSGQVQTMSPAMMSGQVPAMSMSQQPMANMSGGFPQQGANNSGGYAAMPGQFPGAPLSDPRMDPPGTAVSLSRAAPKPARMWVMAFVAVSAAAAIAAFGLTKGGATTQATTAAFVDPSHAPGEALPQPPAATPPQTIPAAQPSAIAQGAAPQPALTPADLLAQTAQPSAVAPQLPQPGSSAVAVAAAPPPPPGVVGVAPPSTPAAAAKVAPVPVTPKASEPKVALKPPVEPKEPKVVQAKPVKPVTPPKGDDGPKKTASPADKEMKDAADALARAQLEQSL